MLKLLWTLTIAALPNITHICLALVDVNSWHHAAVLVAKDDCIVSIWANTIDCNHSLESSIETRAYISTDNWA